MFCTTLTAQDVSEKHQQDVYLGTGYEDQEANYRQYYCSFSFVLSF